MVPPLTRAILSATSDIQQFAMVLNSKTPKTQELDREKAKTDAILNQMLPKQVAYQLKQQRAVRARYYKEVTISFGEIAGFAQLTTQFSPLELVELLNAIYRLFDSRIDLYDVYKVETIGESYMVASSTKYQGTVRLLTSQIIYFTVQSQYDRHVKK